MAISSSVKGTATSTGQPHSSIATGTFTPADNSLLVVVSSGLKRAAGEPDPSCSGGSLSWTRQFYQFEALNYDPWCAIFTAPVTTGASMSVTLSYTNEQMGSTCKVYEVLNANISDPIGVTHAEFVGNVISSKTINFTQTQSTSLVFISACGDEYNLMTIDAEGWTYDGHEVGNAFAETVYGRRIGAYSSATFNIGGTESFPGVFFMTEIKATSKKKRSFTIIHS